MENKNLDVSFDELDKQPITISGNKDNVIYLDTTDIKVITRLNESTAKLNDLVTKNSKALAEINETSIEDFTALLDSYEKDVREIVNYIFDYDVCTPILGNRSVFNIINGTYAFEIIIYKLIELYSESIKTEASNVKKRLSKHTDKYVRK